ADSVSAYIRRARYTRAYTLSLSLSLKLMMRKLGNRVLLVTASLTRPPSAGRYQAIKVPIAALQDGSAAGQTPADVPSSESIFGCGKRVRGQRQARVARGWD